jgi:flagellar hook-length control protein FliK
MLDFSSSGTAGGPLGLLAPAARPEAVSSRPPSRGDKARADFADRLDESLNRAVDDEQDAAPQSDEPVAAAPRAGDADRSETTKDPSRDDEDDETTPACAAAAMLLQGDEKPTGAAVISWPVVPDIANAADAPEESVNGVDAAETTAEARPTDDAASADLKALARELKTVTATSVAGSSRNRGAGPPEIASPLRVGDDIAVSQPIAADAVAEVPAATDTPADVLPQTAPAISTFAETAAAEPEVSNTATAAAATKAAFEQLADRRDEPSADAEARSEIVTAGDQAGDTSHALKQTASSFDAQIAHAGDSRSIVAGAPPNIASHRLAEFEAAARASESAVLAHTPASDTSERLVQSLRLQFQRGGGDAIVQIKPEHLGPVTVSLRVENGAVSARVVADNPTVVEWLQSNEHTLREGLKANGLQLDRLVIHRDQDPSGRTPQRETPHSRRAPQRRSPGRQSTFEITV